jgi:primosomal protein N' (replication factor Y) (superfamily II helicase)
MSFASIILDNNLKKELEYSIPDTLIGKIAPGMRVEVPLQGRLSKGFVFKLLEQKSYPNLRPISRILEEESLPFDLFQLAHFISSYYCTPLKRS